MYKTKKSFTVFPFNQNAVRMSEPLSECQSLTPMRIAYLRRGTQMQAKRITDVHVRLLSPENIICNREINIVC